MLQNTVESLRRKEMAMSEEIQCKKVALSTTREDLVSLEAKNINSDDYRVCKGSLASF
jgi:hypothetical protein